MRAVGMLPVLILLMIGFRPHRRILLHGAELLDHRQRASINIVLAAGTTFVILTGGIDLSVGSILAAAAVVALIVSGIPDIGMLGIAAALLTGLIFGLINGGLIAFLKLPPFIVTSARSPRCAAWPA